MSRIRGKDTKPEMTVRRIVHGLGRRYRLHRRDLPGSPDLVLARLRKVIFVHGCFWHRHQPCPRFCMPKSRVAYWTARLQRNVARDRRNVSGLRRLGWSVLVVWECETKNPEKLSLRLARFLGASARGKPFKFREQ